MKSCTEPAAQTAAKITRKIQILPPLPLVAQRLCKLAENINADLHTVDQVISSDQALAARLLRITNAAFYGLPQRVTTISQAVIVVGFQGVKNLALSVALLDHHISETLSDTHAQFWRHALATGCAARLLARPMRINIAEEGFTAGLLHDIGMLVMIENFSEQYDAVLHAANAGQADLVALEQEQMGINHCAVGRELCRHWQIPETLAVITEHHHDNNAPAQPPSQPARMLLAVQLADLLANIAGLGADGHPLDNPDLRRRATAFLPPETLREVIANLPLEVRKVESLLNLPGAPATHPEEFPQTLLRIENNGWRELVHLTLVALGCAPQARRQNTDVEEVIITDTDTPADQHTRILDLRAMPAFDASRINIAQLRSWLRSELPAGAEAVLP